MCDCQTENFNITDRYRTRLNNIKSLGNIQTDDIVKLIEQLNALRYELLTDINDPCKSTVKDELCKIKKSVDLTLVNIYNVTNALMASDVEITFMHVKLK